MRTNLPIEHARSELFREIAEELSVTQENPRVVLAEALRQIAPLARKGILSEDETQQLLRYLLAAFINSEMDTMLHAMFMHTIARPFGGIWPTRSSFRSKGTSKPTVGLAYR